MLPVLLTVLGIALFSVMDGLMKRAALAGGVYPALFARSVIGALALGPVWWLQGGRWPGPRLLRLHLLRGVLASGMAGSFFYGVVRTPLAQSIAISFIAPLLALGLAATVLGERIRRAAILAALVGLAGVGVIAWNRLGSGPRTPGAEAGFAAIILSAVLYAWNLIVQRQQAQLADPIEVALSQNVVIALVLGLGAPLLAAGSVLLGGEPHGATLFAVQAMLIPVQAAWLDIAGSALLVSTSLMLLSWAYARVEAQWLLPLEYTAFGWAALIGWWWFGEAVSGWTLTGLVLILAGVWLGTRQSNGIAAAQQVPPG